MPSTFVNTYKKLLPQGLLAALLTGIFLYLFLQREAAMFILGLFIGLQSHFFIITYESLIRPKLSKRNFFLALLTSTIANILLIILAVFLSLSYINKFNFLWVLSNFNSILLSDYMLKGLSFGLVLSFVFNSFSMFDTLLGKNFLFKLFTGRYHIPFEEERVFMFLDLKSSTTLAEQLGHKAFMSLLNDFFYDVSLAVSETKGEIYKYVGDEAIITWKMKYATGRSMPVDCFFLIKKLVADKKSSYLKKYGTVPVFKSGLHGGKVVTGEMGYVKKEIAFLGDVLNTTARIEALCNELNRELLISDDLLQKIDLDSRYSAESFGEIPLKGKIHPVKIYSVSRADGGL